MSGESAQHVNLVERLVATVEQRHQTTRGIVVFADHRSFGVNQPPMIGGYFKSERSLYQIEAFLNHLALYANSTFYLAVPWFLKGRANFVIRDLSRPDHKSVNICVLPFA
jgi:hypothetical protein